MSDRPTLVIHQKFADLPDLRVERTTRHTLGRLRDSKGGSDQADRSRTSIRS